MTKPIEVRWYYHGPDNEIYGPYAAKEMMMWTQSGYFNDSLLIRTEHEERFHTLGEWTRVCGGKVPFVLPVVSMESLVGPLGPRLNPVVIGMLPPGLPPPFPPPVHGRFAHFVPGMPPPQAHQQPPMTHSLPPSEPLDAGSSLSHTPDSEQEMYNHAKVNGETNGTSMMPTLRHMAVSTAEPPEMVSVSTATDNPTMRDAACQTTPLIVPAQDAARILSELLNQVVRVT
ncbi:GYF domain protein [Ancylostoma duodenale]|uniref:GYF domain protein n=1 Tax=Ancylostoma duodenale TaxID=51022 RepID=A0A0C2DK01_9BILA|nr:GYF domain protein [Ancylostoma duodenale]